MAAALGLAPPDPPFRRRRRNRQVDGGTALAHHRDYVHTHAHNRTAPGGPCPLEQQGHPQRWCTWAVDEVAVVEERI